MADSREHTCYDGHCTPAASLGSSCRAQEDDSRSAGQQLIDELVAENVALRRAQGDGQCCDCESYDCTGQCCGVGRCSCTPGFAEAVAARLAARAQDDGHCAPAALVAALDVFVDYHNRVGAISYFNAETTGQLVKDMCGPAFAAGVAAGRKQAAAAIRAWLRGEIETWPPPVTLAEVGKGAAEIAEGTNHAD